MLKHADSGHSHTTTKEAKVENRERMEARILTLMAEDDGEAEIGVTVKEEPASDEVMDEESDSEIEIITRAIKIEQVVAMASPASPPPSPAIVPHPPSSNLSTPALSPPRGGSTPLTTASPQMARQSQKPAAIVASTSKLPPRPPLIAPLLNQATIRSALNNPLPDARELTAGNHRFPSKTVVIPETLAFVKLAASGQLPPLSPAISFRSSYQFAAFLYATAESKHYFTHRTRRDSYSAIFSCSKGKPRYERSERCRFFVEVSRDSDQYPFKITRCQLSHNHVTLGDPGSEKVSYFGVRRSS